MIDTFESLPAAPNVASKTSAPDDTLILNAILNTRASLGEGLNDDELTHFLLAKIPAQEAFSFLCYAQGCVTFSVPEQDPANWYSDKRWIAEQKETLAQEIAAKFHLTLCEPPDKLSYIIPPAEAHHHLEFTSHCDTISIAHPLYLKIRVARAGGTQSFWTRKKTLPASVELFRELTKLYLP